MLVATRKFEKNCFRTERYLKYSVPSIIEVNKRRKILRYNANDKVIRKRKVL